MSWVGAPGPGIRNDVRIQLDASCTIEDEASGDSETYYLIAPCRAEYMYRDGPMFVLPNWEFCGIWSKRDYLIIRTHWSSHRDNRTYGAPPELFSEVHLDIRTFPKTRCLLDDAEIVKATMDKLPLVARTELRDEQRRVRAVLQYSVKTMNLSQAPPCFQVDTGPAHVVYNALDKAEFLLRKPTSILEGDKLLYSTTDYSVVGIVPARTEIVCGD